MGKMLDSTLSWIFEKMAKAYVHRTGSNLPDAKVPVVQDVDGKPYFNLSSIGSADLAKLSGANGIDGTIAEAISGLKGGLNLPIFKSTPVDFDNCEQGLYYSYSIPSFSEWSNYGSDTTSMVLVIKALTECEIQITNQNTIFFRSRYYTNNWNPWKEL